MPRLEQLSKVQRNTALMFPCMDHDLSPCTPLPKPLSQCKVALVTSAGLHLREDKPFGRADTSYRLIPSKAPARDILQSHSSIGFDHTAFYRDINISFPIDRLRELVDEGVVGSLANSFYSFMGAQRDARKLLETSAPVVAQLLKDEGVDVVLLTPT